MTSIDRLSRLNFRAKAAMGAGMVLLATQLLLGCPGGGSGGPIIECGGGPAFQCPPGMYCLYGPECGGLDHRGRCKPMPQECPPEENPVCGCDHATYGSECYAAASGASVDYKGPCIIKEGEEDK